MRNEHASQGFELSTYSSAAAAAVFGDTVRLRVIAMSGVIAQSEVIAPPCDEKLNGGAIAQGCDDWCDD